MNSEALVTIGPFCKWNNSDADIVILKYFMNHTLSPKNFENFIVNYYIPHLTENNFRGKLNDNAIQNSS